MTDRDLPHTTRTCVHGMYVRERGPGGDLTDHGTLLFLHGLGESGLCFEKLLKHSGLACRQLLIPDLPGYGRSPWTAAPLTMVAQADHLADWLRETGRGRVVVVGHSLGGVLGLLLCERHPDLAAALIDVDGNKCLDDCVFSSQAMAYDLAGFMASGHERLCEIVHRLGRSDLSHRGYYVSLRLCDPCLYPLHSRELVEMSEREDLAHRLANLPVPHLYIAGVPDGAAPRSRELLDLAGVNWIAVQPAGHWPFLDRPDAFVTAVIRFLDDIESG